MEQETVREAVQRKAVRPEGKVSGISFCGYRSQYDGKGKIALGNTETVESGTEDSQKAVAQVKHTDYLPAYMILSALDQKRVENHTWIKRKYPQEVQKGNIQDVSIKEAGNDRIAHTGIRKPGILGTAEPAGTGQEKEFRQQTLIAKKRKEFLTAGEQKKCDTRKEFDLAWHHEACQHGAGKKPDIVREEMLRFCNIGEKRTAIPGIRTMEQHTQGILEQEDIRREPLVCHVKERAEWEDTKAGKKEKKPGRNAAKADSGKDTRADQTGNDYPEKRKTDRIKQKMLRDYIIKELIHEEGTIDPDSHFHLIASMVKHNILKLTAAGGKLLLKLVKCMLAAVFPYLLAAAAVLVPFVFLLMFLLNPVSYFSGIYDTREEVKEHPLYVKNVLQEMYEDFYGRISTFTDSDGNNQIHYETGKYSVFNEIMSVYLAQIVNEEDYGKTEEEDGNYPPYLLIDTVEERNLLQKVFEEFNDTKTEDIEVTVKGEDGKDREVSAKKMTVYCITVEKWKEAYLSGLTEDAQKMLDTLLATSESAGDSYEPGTGNSIPITGMVIPEGVDEKLVYLAGFLKAEAGNQPYQGKVAVAYVILNRAGGASGNIKGVLTAPYQFSCYIPYHTVEKYLLEYASMTDAQRAQDACWKAAEAAYYGMADNPVGSMKYYCNPKACSVGAEEQWRKINARNTKDEIIVIGDHVFCSNCW